MADDLRILEQEYCPPVDPALVHAIYSDYAGTAQGIQLARDLLDGIKQAADDEQAADFDASGSSGPAAKSSPEKQGSEDVESNADSWATRTTLTDETNLSNGLSTLSVDGRSGSGSEGSQGSSDGGYFRDTDRLDTPTKELVLAETFPTLRPDLVAYTLKKCDNDFERATDELLNHVYFEDSRASPDELPVARGIDAFAEEFQIPQRGKKGKAKRKQRRSAHYSGSAVSASGSDVSSTASPNRWLDSGRDVEYIASRMNLSTATVASFYHKNGASRSGTILALIQKDVHMQGKAEPDASLVEPALDLITDFPSIDLEHAIALVRLTAPSAAHAQDLARTLTQHPTTPTALGGVKVIPQYTPVNLSTPTPEPHRLPALPPSAVPNTFASLSSARSAAFTQASDAYRKGKSNPLMKAAAGYYAQVGRDLHAHLAATNEADADALVASQSSATVLDLHGVSVLSATRIAKASTRAWWAGLGELRIPGGGRAGAALVYRIVTGLGRHSEGGRGKIGPAVVRALVREGWKVEVGTGELLVMGLARRK
ncbi:hypothetical protein BDV95DRAFT_595905 [Massariosphaeria phaeospora]|uniref:CUE domain-containing protein n=1 Tax=Massariosphaeria phaeospora TaxID=100035 RepID=A0A7C8M703_9PLEO|nr:hypothetical protein BDV95DRAFT_595905 [Massariosphaeria phaeospora]